MNNDLISREALKKKLQEHHDFFVNAWGGFKNLPPNDKARVDEITHCISEVVNAPTVNDCPNCEYKLEADYIRSSSSYKELINLRKFKEKYKRPQGEWHGSTKSASYLVCNLCGMSVNYMQVEEGYMLNFCPNCGARMKGGES